MEVSPIKVYCGNCSKVIREVPDDQATAQDVNTLEPSSSEPGQRRRELCEKCKARAEAK